MQQQELYHLPEKTQTATEMQPVAQNCGLIIAILLHFFLSITMGFSLIRIFLNFYHLQTAIFYLLFSVGSILSVIFMHKCIRKPEYLAGKQPRSKMLLLTVASSVKLTALLFYYLKAYFAFPVLLIPPTVFEVFLIIYVFLVFFADESNGNSCLVGLKPFVLKETPIISSVVYAYPQLHGLYPQSPHYAYPQGPTYAYPQSQTQDQVPAYVPAYPQVPTYPPAYPHVHLDSKV